MKEIYRTIGLVAAAGLISLGVYNFKGITSVKNNPFKYTSTVQEMLDIKRDAEMIDDLWRMGRNNNSAILRLHYWDDQKEKLLTRLNAPAESRQEILAELSKSYWQDFYKITSTNQTWKSYEEWNTETRGKNKGNLISGLLAILAGTGLVALSMIRGKGK